MIHKIMGSLYRYLKQKKVFGPVAILFGHLSVLILHNCTQLLMDKGELYSHGVMTFFLAGAYIHSWSLNNPHMAEPAGNLAIHELALSLAGGYYACNICTSKSCMEAIKNLVSIMIVSGTLTNDKGANIVVTYAFLYEIPTLFSRLAEYADSLTKYPCKALFVLLHPVVLISCRAIGLWHLTFMIVANKDIPLIFRAEVVLLTVCSFSTFKRTVNMLGKSQSQTQIIVPPPRTRSRSNIRSRSRSMPRAPYRGRSRSRRC